MLFSSNHQDRLYSIDECIKRGRERAREELKNSVTAKVRALCREEMQKLNDEVSELYNESEIRREMKRFYKYTTVMSLYQNSGDGGDGGDDGVFDHGYDYQLMHGGVERGGLKRFFHNYNNLTDDRDELEVTLEIDVDVNSNSSNLSRLGQMEFSIATNENIRRRFDGDDDYGDENDENDGSKGELAVLESSVIPEQLMISQSSSTIGSEMISPLTASRRLRLNALLSATSETNRNVTMTSSPEKLKKRLDHHGNLKTFHAMDNSRHSGSTIPTLLSQSDLQSQYQEDEGKQLQLQLQLQQQKEGETDTAQSLSNNMRSNDMINNARTDDTSSMGEVSIGNTVKTWQTIQTTQSILELRKRKRMIEKCLEERSIGHQNSSHHHGKQIQIFNLHHQQCLKSNLSPIVPA